MEEQILKILLKDWRYPVQKSSKDITAHVFEFIEWKDKNTYYDDEFDFNVYSINTDMGGGTLEDIYEYWLNNIKDK